MELELLTHLLNLGDDAEQRRIADRLHADPDAQVRLALMRKALDPLETDRDAPEPPPGLVDRTIGLIAQHICERGDWRPADNGDRPVGEILSEMSPQKLLRLVEVMDRANGPPSRWRRGDIVVVASILAVAVGMILSATVQVRHRQNLIACQNNLRNLHGALHAYSDIHNNEFPRVSETPPLNTAGSFLAMLRGAGTLSPTSQASCPSLEVQSPGYAYTLGYREGSQLFGLRLEPDQNNDYLAIVADRSPDRTGTGPVHGGGQNVLFISGNVRYCTTTRVGVDGDDIYHNEQGLIGAGMHRYDSVLGVGPDHP